MIIIIAVWNEAVAGQGLAGRLLSASDGNRYPTAGVL